VSDIVVSGLRAQRFNGDSEFADDLGVGVESLSERGVLVVEALIDGFEVSDLAAKVLVGGRYSVGRLALRLERLS